MVFPARERNEIEGDDEKSTKNGNSRLSLKAVRVCCTIKTKVFFHPSLEDRRLLRKRRKGYKLNECATEDSGGG